MKCDNCEHMCTNIPTLEDPYRGSWCNKGHWDSEAPSDTRDIDLWVNCIDYKKEG